MGKGPVPALIFVSLLTGTMLMFNCPQNSLSTSPLCHHWVPRQLLSETAVQCQGSQSSVKHAWETIRMCPTQPCSARRFLSETCSIHIVIFSRGLAVLVAQVRMQKEDYGVECKICARASLGLLVLQRVCATFLRPGLSRSSDGKLARKVDTRPVFKMRPGGGRCRGFRGRPRSCVLDSGRLESLWSAL